MGKKQVTRNKMFRHLKHPNIVSLLGYSMDEGQMVLVMNC